MKVKRPLTPADVRPHVGVHVSIPVVTHDEFGRPKLGRKTIDLLKNKNVGRPAEK